MRLLSQIAVINEVERLGRPIRIRFDTDQARASWISFKECRKTYAVANGFFDGIH